MPSFVAAIKDGPGVEEYMRQLNQRLQSENYFSLPFRGRVRAIPGGLYAITIEPIYPRYVLNMCALFMAGAGVLALVVGFGLIGRIAITIAAALAVALNAFWSGDAYRLGLGVGLWIKTRKFHAIGNGNREALRRLSYGKV